MHSYPLPKKTLHCGARTLDLAVPQVMGILNVTPDSFSDGGQFVQRDAALRQAEQMLKDGASIIDVGGESTRPNALPVGEQIELDRVVPIVEAIAERLDVVISVDTSTPCVFEQAAAVGAVIWNDVRALGRPQARETAARLGLPVVLMHNRGEPSEMNDLAVYESVVGEVLQELTEQIDLALAAGVLRENIVLDVGFGFAKNTQQNLILLKHLGQLIPLNYPLLVGISRKRVLGEVLADAAGMSRAVAQRVDAGLAAALIGVQHGASLIRTHDVRPTVDVLKLWQAMIFSDVLSSDGEVIK
ncbi:MAG: dihydropteroate synthase [Pseudomonadota bacterium]|nr:dihydropteroate synthase [Pseudomonadota bacterium]